MSRAYERPDARFRATVEAALAAGERLTAEDGVGLLRCDDLSWLGGLAHRRRTAAAGTQVTFLPDAPASAASPDARTGGVTKTGDVATLTYGEGDEPDDLVGTMLQLRDEVAAGTVTLLVLSRSVPEAETPEPSPAESMKLAAVARLLVDGLPHLGCDLASHAVSTAALMLQFGVSDLLVPTGDLDADAVAVLIWDAGFTPVHRDAGFEPVRDYGEAASQAQRRAEPQSVFD